MSQSTTNEPSSQATDHTMYPPAWQRDDKFSKIFAPYSRAKQYISGRPLPELWDINNGCILWLPARADIEDKIIPGSKVDRQKDGFFDHPVVVLKVERQSPTAALLTFARLTSFGNQNLRQAKAESNWQHYLPIRPSAPHPESGILLDLENEKTKRSMKENSHIILQETFTLEFTAFRCYALGQKGDGYRQRLTQDSFDQLAKSLGMEPGNWIKTDDLWENFENYLELQP